MIIIKLTGGLGNQLFQYAMGRAYALKHKSRMYLDISWYKGRIDRTFILDKFNIDVKIANKFDVIITKILNRKNYIVGDWQSEKYFLSAAETIKKEYSLKNTFEPHIEQLSKQVKEYNSVSIHLRGGDYVRGKKSGFHGTCSPKYYSDAIDYIKSRIASPHFFIFTDDLEWAKSHITFPKPYTFVSGNNKPYEELILMSQCKHNIIANSTFSWWAAWLNNNPDKIVIGPKKWFNDEKIDTSDILPTSWIKM